MPRCGMPPPPEKWNCNLLIEIDNLGYFERIFSEIIHVDLDFFFGGRGASTTPAPDSWFRLSLRWLWLNKSDYYSTPETWLQVQTEVRSPEYQKMCLCCALYTISYSPKLSSLHNFLRSPKLCPLHNFTLSKVVPSTQLCALQRCASYCGPTQYYPLQSWVLYTVLHSPKLCPLHNFTLSKVVPATQFYTLQCCARYTMLPFLKLYPLHNFKLPKVVPSTQL